MKPTTAKGLPRRNIALTTLSWAIFQTALTGKAATPKETLPLKRQSGEQIVSPTVISLRDIARLAFVKVYRINVRPDERERSEDATPESVIERQL